MNMPFFKLAIADILIMSSLIVLVSSAWMIFDHWYKPVITVNVHKVSSTVDHYKLKDVLNQMLSNQNYFFVSLPDLSRALSQLDFVRDSQVRRQWPLSFSVIVDVEEPVAYWVDPNKASNRSDYALPSLLMNKYGETFYPKTTLGKALPVLSALRTGYDAYDENNKKNMAKRLQRWQSLAAQYFDDLRITRIEITPGQMWNIEWNGRIWTNIGQEIEEDIKDIIQGDSWLMPKNTRHHPSQEDVLHKRVIHFLASWPQLKQEYLDQSLKVDMRYPNKMAVSVFE